MYKARGSARLNVMEMSRNSLEKVMGNCCREVSSSPVESETVQS